MAKINHDNSGPNSTNDGKLERIMALFQTGNQAVNMLLNVYSSVNSSNNDKKNMEAENLVKLRKAEKDIKFEENRHKEKMNELTCELEKVFADAADKKKKNEIIEEIIKYFQAEYDKYLSYEKEEFLNDKVSEGLASLRKTIIEFTKEMLRS